MVLRLQRHHPQTQGRGREPISARLVADLFKAAGADVVGFQRLVVGEGIEKVVEDYAAEVMKQAGLA